MPKLLLFAPFSRAIIDNEDNTLTLVALLEGVTFAPADPAEELDPRTGAATNWTAVAV